MQVQRVFFEVDFVVVLLKVFDYGRVGGMIHPGQKSLYIQFLSLEFRSGQEYDANK